MLPLDTPIYLKINMLEDNMNIYLYKLSCKLYFLNQTKSNPASCLLCQLTVRTSSVSEAGSRIQGHKSELPSRSTWYLQYLVLVPAWTYSSQISESRSGSCRSSWIMRLLSIVDVVRRSHTLSLCCRMGECQILWSSPLLYTLYQ